MGKKVHEIQSAGIRKVRAGRREEYIRVGEVKLRVLEDLS